MNDILAAEMEEALYGMDSNEHQKEGFAVNDDNKADWALKRIKENQAKIDEISELYEQQTLRLVHWRNEEMDKLIKNNEALESMIMPYAAAKLEKSRHKSFKLPNGKCGFRSVPPKFIMDEEKLLKFAESSVPNVVKVKKSVDWAALKKLVENNNGKAVMIETGEIVDGVKVEVQPPKFYVEVNK